MMKSLMAAALAAMALAPASDARADGPVLVELFTSQGCSSCPPADKLLGELAGRDDVIALSLHVDYWDYLGWKDAFADPAHTKRQRGYAKRSGSTMIYTPQMVIGGRDHIVGTKAMELARQIERHKSLASSVTLNVIRDGSGKLRITARRVSDVPSKMVVQLIRYTQSHTVKIKSGENAGKAITYHNVVDSLAQIGKWNGGADLDMTADAPGEAPGVVLIQDGTSGPVLAAARID